MKLIDIKGKRDYIRFILEDGTFIKGSGEMLQNRFCVYEQTLRIFTSGNDSHELSQSQLKELKSAVAELPASVNFNVIFE